MEHLSGSTPRGGGTHQLRGVININQSVSGLLPCASHSDPILMPRKEAVFTKNMMEDRNGDGRKP